MRRVTDFRDRVALLVDDWGVIVERHTFDDLRLIERDALRCETEKFAGPTTAQTPPSVAMSYLLSRSWAKPGMDAASQVNRALREVAAYREAKA